MNQVDSYSVWEPIPISAKRLKSKLTGSTTTFLYNDAAVDRVFRQLFLATKRSRRLQRVLRSSSVSVLHAHFGRDAILVRREARRARIPLVVTLHGYDVTVAPKMPGIRGAYYRRQLRRVFDQSALVLAVSEHIASHAIALGAPPEKVIVQYIGVPIPTRSFTHPGDYLLFVGRLVEKKGVADLIKASALLRAKNVLPIHIVGDGPLRAELEQQAAQYGVEVTFHGVLPSPDVKALMARSRAVVVPSRTASNGDTEGLPTVVVEALAEGRPVIAYAHAGIPEAVQNGRSGILVPEGDVRSLADAMWQLSTDVNRATELGRAAREDAEERFDIQHQTLRLESLYNRVCLPRT